MNEAIKNLSTTVVPNCFRKAGFQLPLAELEMFEDDAIFTELHDLMVQFGADDLSVEEYVRIDEEVLTESDTDFNVNNYEISCDLHNDADENDEKDSNDDDNSDQTMTVSVIRYSEALEMLKELKLFACSKENNVLLDKFTECANLIQDDFISKKNKQATITDFFSRTN